MFIAEALLPDMAAAAIAFTLITYVVLDGTDLGVGMLFATRKCPRERQIMANSILPIWDGNETWLVLGGGGLLALFPVAYSLIFSALYIPVFSLLLSLVFRAVALEFRADASLSMKRWLDRTLMAGSLMATLCQGLIMGSVLQGIKNDEGRFTGNGWEWLSPFPLACGLVMVCGYALLGSCWLVWRTEGPLQKAARGQARWLGWLMLVSLFAIVIWTCALDPAYRVRLTDVRYALPLLTVQGLLLVGFRRAFFSRHEFLPLFAALGWFVVAFVTAILAMYPLIVPASLTVQEAASPPLSQVFMLSGFAVLVPATLAYNTYGFWVFRGKVKADPL
ncbi:cytochrome d ubiquinol oxidase subunit II [Pseudomonas sp.]|jgi:cytochrome d ubiquinol oxidase subunit II|uniref:cytochrome d ubiquinol oxidase subunit II n=1 Tax=Pseudomonas sp. TaxID=306 RepID=UPI002EDB5004